MKSSVNDFLNDLILHIDYTFLKNNILINDVYILSEDTNNIKIFTKEINETILMNYIKENGNRTKYPISYSKIIIDNIYGNYTYKVIINVVDDIKYKSGVKIMIFRYKNKIYASL